MKLANPLSDEAILKELGCRLAQERINRSLTQEQLAHAAGIAKRTLEHIEAGDSVQLVSLVRVLRELALLEALDSLLPEVGPRPMDYLKRKGRVRQRASVPRVKEDPAKPWKWGDEQ